MYEKTAFLFYHFKKYNDTFGHVIRHEAGDVLLSKIGNIFKKSIRESDLIARYGGEEFLIAISETLDEPIGNIAERIRKNVEEGSDVTISIGISCFRNGLKIKDLVVEADTALYKAKKQGRNRVVFLNFHSNDDSKDGVMPG